MKQLIAAFVRAKKTFSPALKTSTNPHFKKKYADLAACLDAVDDALLENGIVVYQETIDNEKGIIIETVLCHESGETLRCGKLFVPAAKHDPQGFGSALTYARRYSLMAACGIAAEEDDGNKATEALKKEAEAAKKRADLFLKLAGDATNGMTKEQKFEWSRSLFGEELNSVLSKIGKDGSYLQKLEKFLAEKKDFEAATNGH